MNVNAKRIIELKMKQKWVRIGTDGSIGPCGTSKDKKNPDRCTSRKGQFSF